MSLFRLLVASSLLAGCGGKHQISGMVVDRNGQPLPRAVVSLEPGNVSLVTDTEGRFLIDYLRDDSGKRIRLSPRRDYQLEVFKVGFHTFEQGLAYRRGPFEIDQVRLVEETVRIEIMEEEEEQEKAWTAFDRPNSSGSGRSFENE